MRGREIVPTRPQTIPIIWRVHTQIYDISTPTSTYSIYIYIYILCVCELGEREREKEREREESIE